MSDIIPNPPPNPQQDTHFTVATLTVHRQNYTLNTKYITSSQNTTKSIALCCTICYTTTCFGPFLGHLQVVSA